MPDNAREPILQDSEPHDPDLHDPVEAARAAKLHYVTDRCPGITRTRDGDERVFHDPSGAEITDPKVLDRIRKLAIPPAYTDVWICKDPRGHLQAVGRDAKGRKQYRYHARWREIRDEAKYGKMLTFGRVLPVVRAAVRCDLALHGLPKRKVVAATVALLERTMMRVGNEEYARANNSFGLTTLKDQHVQVKGGHLTFDFRGKHGVEHHIDLDDRRLARVVERCRDLPGQDLFQFLDQHGERHHIVSDDVNEYLREASGEDITAKDFRTWAATNLAALALRDLILADTPAKTKKQLVEVVEHVAKNLGNTPAICRKCYIHPAVFEGYLDGSLLACLKERADETLAGDHGLTPDEVAVTTFLSRRLGEAAADPAHKPLAT